MEKAIYIAGPMRGIVDFNFRAFDALSMTLRSIGWIVYNPAERDRTEYGDTFKSVTGDIADLKNGFDLRRAFSWDADVIINKVQAVAFLDGWENSTGAKTEYAIAKMLGRTLYDQRMVPIHDPVTLRATDAFNGEVIVTDATTGGKKGQKSARFDLIPAWPLWELARLYGYGCEKYDDDNWRKGYSWKLSIGAMLRHVFMFLRGESLDPETKCHHLASVAWHAFTLMWFEKNRKGTDDRTDKE